MCVDNLSEVALDSAAAGIEPATSSRKSNALTTRTTSHRVLYYGDTTVSLPFLSVINVVTKSCTLVMLTYVSLC